MKEHRFLNKVDFTVHPSQYPNNNEGNMKLYYLFSLIKDSYESKSNDLTVGYPESLEDHLVFFKTLVDTMEMRNLQVPNVDKSTIWKQLALHARLEAATQRDSTYHCPTCGTKLKKADIDSLRCGECHGKLVTVKC